MKRCFFRAVVTTVVILVSTSMVSFAGEWKQDGSGWWYQNDDGSYPVSSWKEINEKQYYFDVSGYMLYDTTTPDGYRVGADGVWISDSNRESGSSEDEVTPEYKVYMNSKTNPNAKYIIMEYKNNSEDDIIVHSKLSRLYDGKYENLNRDLELVEAGTTSVNNINSITISPGERKMLSFSVKGSSTYYDKNTIISFIVKTNGRAYRCMSSADGNSKIVRAKECDDINTETN